MGKQYEPEASDKADEYLAFHRLQSIATSNGVVSPMVSLDWSDYAHDLVVRICRGGRAISSWSNIMVYPSPLRSFRGPIIAAQEGPAYRC